VIGGMRAKLEKIEFLDLNAK